jgi:hypothetical protein
VFGLEADDYHALHALPSSDACPEHRDCPGRAKGAAASRTTARTEVLYAAVEYKETWAVAFASYDRAGVDRPEPVPHPDDVNINYETGDVTITGPVMTEQKVARERLLAARSELEQNLTDCIKAMEADPDDLSLRRVRKKLTQITDWLRRGAPFAK